MDISEAIKIVQDRIQKIEPQHASKIVGYLLQEHGDQHMIRLVFSADNEIKKVVSKVLQWLTNFYTSSLYNSKLYNISNYTNHLNYRPNFSTFLLNKSLRRLRNSIDFPIKVCIYFNKGFCKYGANCKFFHDINSNTHGNNDHVMYSAESLEKLEIDLIELLRLRNGDPISIVSLPMLYYNKFNRAIPVERHHIESQREVKGGCKLTGLLRKLKKSIRLIEWRDGQNYVILSEDASSYHNGEHDRTVSESKQIYLTFPPESVFTDIDVLDYFTKFGLVQDVRIPSQEKRMYGFVAFVDPKTTQIVLKRGNPHYICGARVLVKPYKEKLRMNTREVNSLS